MDKSYKALLPTIVILLGIFCLVSVYLLNNLPQYVSVQLGIKERSEILTNIFIPVFTLAAVLSSIAIFKFQHDFAHDNKRINWIKFYTDKIDQLLIELNSIIQQKAVKNKYGITYRSKKPNNSVTVYTYLMTLTNLFSRLNKYLENEDNDVNQTYRLMCTAIIIKTYNQGYISKTTQAALYQSLELSSSGFTEEPKKKFFNFECVKLIKTKSRKIMDMIIKNKTFKWVCAIITFLLFLVVFIYALRVKLIPKPNDNLMSDFATYFNGLTMPFLTIFSVLALLATFRAQKEQFKKQQNDRYLEKYLDRYLSKYEEYLSLMKVEVQELNDQSLETKLATNQINMIKTIMTKPYNCLTSNEIKVRTHINELASIVDDAYTNLSYSYKYASKDDAVYINSMKNKADIMADKLLAFGYLNWEERKKYSERIDISTQVKGTNIVSTVYE